MIVISWLVKGRYEMIMIQNNSHERNALLLLQTCLDNACECQCVDPPEDREENDERGNDSSNPEHHAQYCPVYLRAVTFGKRHEATEIETIPRRAILLPTHDIASKAQAPHLGFVLFANGNKKPTPCGMGFQSHLPYHHLGGGVSHSPHLPTPAKSAIVASLIMWIVSGQLSPVAVV